MALTDQSGNMVMPVSPMGNYGGGFGSGFGNDGWWIILLFILLGNNGWGGYGYGNGGGVGFVDSTVQRGFDQSAIMNGITGIQSSVTSGFGDVQNALCAGFNGVEIGANARQMASMQQMFDLQSALASCCCENRLASADLKYTVATENCADRYEAAQNTRDIIDSQTRGTQAILDKLCALEIESKNDTIAQLRSELIFARGQASQDVQTAAIQAGQRGLANEIEQYLAPTPKPAYVVANPNCCNAVTGCGCSSF